MNLCFDGCQEIANQQCLYCTNWFCYDCLPFSNGNIYECFTCNWKEENSCIFTQKMTTKFLNTCCSSTNHEIDLQLTHLLEQFLLYQNIAISPWPKFTPSLCFSIPDNLSIFTKFYKFNPVIFGSDVGIIEFKFEKFNIDAVVYSKKQNFVYRLNVKDIVLRIEASKELQILNILRQFC